MKKIIKKLPKKEITAGLRCIHRHLITEHRNCFNKDGYPLNNPTSWYDGLKIAYLDLESDGLRADFSTMLCWCVKEQNGNINSSIVTKKELFSGDSDRRLVSELIDEINKYDIVVTYYGKGFDIPYLRSKALHYGLEFPGFVRELVLTRNTIKTTTKSLIYHWDLYFAVKSKLNLSRKSLDNVCDYLGIEGKTPLDKETWRTAKYGDVKSLQEVLNHCKGDVIILEELHNKIWDLGKWDRSPL